MRHVIEAGCTPEERESFAATLLAPAADGGGDLVDTLRAQEFLRLRESRLPALAALLASEAPVRVRVLQRARGCRGRCVRVHWARQYLCALVDCWAIGHVEMLIET